MDFIVLLSRLEFAAKGLNKFSVGQAREALHQQTGNKALKEAPCLFMSPKWLLKGHDDHCGRPPVT
jgi:hypothetical protein